MSHFSVMVIGENVEEQLAPYDENKRLEIPVINGEVSWYTKETMMEYYKKPEHGGLDLPFDELYALKGSDWNNNEYQKRDGVWVKTSTYNPKSKWDWYQLGGRWNGFLKLKYGHKGTNGDDDKIGYCDQTIKKSIDVKGMRNEAGDKAGKYYDTVMELIAGTPEPIYWSDFIKRVENNEIEIDVARTQYHDQPRLKALSTPEAREKIGFFFSLEDFNVTREEYVQMARNEALSTFAIVKDGEWYQKGEMGWFGMSTDEMTQTEWNNKVSEMFDELPEDTMISIIDCHI